MVLHMTLKEPLISQVPLFAKLPAEEHAYLAATLRQVAYPSGALLFREGDYGEHFYIVLEGELEIIKALGTASELMLDARGSGEFVGEMSMFNRDNVRTASVRTRGLTQLLEMHHGEFDALMHRHPDLAYEMVRVLSTRLRDANNATIRDLQDKNRQLTQAYLDLQTAQAQIIEQETLARELQVARNIQEHMLPRSLPNLAGFDFSARMVPARVVGGDFYDFIPLDDDRLGIVVADVCGKSLPAALLMALTYVPAATLAQYHGDGSKAPGSTSGGGPSGSGAAPSPSTPPSADTPSTPGTPAPAPSTGSPSTPSSRHFTNQSDCERAGGKWQAAQNKCEIGG